ncbi:unnamed protein product [Euphydryas editha]|nr:unnamed protein product [Euphydryas editha]
MVVNGTTGLKTWEAALMLSDWAVCHKEIFTNKNVLELGSGVGFTGVMMLDWNNTEDLVLQFIPDIVIGADIVYDPSILQSLLNVLILMHKNNNNIDVYIASVIRNQDTFSEFLKALDTFNFKYEDLKLINNGYIDWDSSVNKSLLRINKK